MIAQSLTTAAAASPSPVRDGAEPNLCLLSAFPLAPGSAPEEVVAHWVRTYLMRPHPELGRAGAVCPFTPASARLDALLIGSSRAAREDEILAVMARALRAFGAIRVPPEQRHFRAVIVAFPDCGGEEGRARLKAVQNRLRPESILRAKMIGLFDPGSQEKGLINPDFRPLRSPVPLLAIRMLVANDAPFVLRNPRLLPVYLMKFPLSGPLELWHALWR